MDDFLTSIIVNALFFGFAFWLGYHYAHLKLMFRISQEPEKMMEILSKIKKLNEKEEAGAPVDAVWVELEEAQGHVYLYDKLSNQFLGQGKNVSEALKMAGERFPGKTFWLPKTKVDNQTT